ncbi:MAG: 3-alpha-hydroxysteroid dehydrogenase [Acidimicrobiales bacterium]|jgi:3alpha(or 20beta)-hydroxysteroid dehydrogenase|nr:3-alpha-hydroxysteroid dehydrogenase [Acidimicrobiales bacterium]
MSGRLDGKVALITGAAQGQGEAEARLFAAEGAHVVLGDVNDEVGGKLAAEIGGTWIHLDVTSEDDWAAAESVVAGLGGLDALVSNAGIARPPLPIANTPLDAYRQVIDVNQIGTFLALRSGIRAMTAGGRPGSIVLISSVNGIQGAAGIASYVSSKFAIRGLAKVAALEVGPSGIRVNSVHPGPIDTPMIQPAEPGGWDMRPALAQMMPLRRIGQPADVAELVCWLASDASSFCTGSEFVIDGGYLAGPSHGVHTEYADS